MALVLDGSNGITFPNASVQNNAVANNAAVLALIGSRGLTNTVMPAGTILQVIQSQSNTQQSFSAATTLTGLNPTITPMSSTSKIWITSTIWISNNTATGNFYAQLRRNGTNIGLSGTDTAGYAGISAYRVLNEGQSPYSVFNMGFSWVDSPATTSALTYTIVGQQNAGTTYTNSSASGSYFSMYSTITVMEIAQ